jgi:ribosomal protein S18 acetylase RimI-like enzyme
MAARLHPTPSPTPELVDLRRLSSYDLEPLLREEAAAWQEELEWDFEKSADLVRRFVDLRALNGSALIENGQVTGYLYYVLEESKGLIGDLYIRRASRDAEREDLLIQAAIDGLMATPHISRIESQLLMLDYTRGRDLPCSEHLSVYERNFMRVDLSRASLGEGHVRRPVYFERWSDHYQDAVAQLICSAYGGHVDSRINDQYRSVMGARRFLYNIVQYPGCGAFFRPASYAAFEGVRGQLCGVSLASLVAPASGHITQICVLPEMRGTGIGYAMLRQSLLALREMGCRSASLTVTASNENAVALYERVGFETIRRFAAYVWEGF